MAKIGFGIVTCDRPEFFKTAITSVDKYLGRQLDYKCVFNDGLRLGYSDYASNWQTGGKYQHEGVAHAKNWILRRLIKNGCTHLFVMEDDMEVISDKLLAVYIAAAKINKMPHLNFSQHGPNTTIPYVAGNGTLDYWPNACGAFSYYTREIIEEFGYMDENFKGAYEHVEHTWRIYKSVFPYGVYPDVVNSTDYIREQPGALEATTGGDRKERLENINKARVYWQSKDKDCPLRGGTI